MKCEECDGTGRVEYERTHGGVDSNGPWMSFYVYETECELCRGAGEIDDEQE